MMAFRNFLLSAQVPVVLAFFISSANAALFHATGRMGVARVGHTMTLLPDGKVLVAGGGVVVIGTTYFSKGVIVNSFVTNSAEIYDPSSGTWTAADGLTFGRAGHTATLLTNGMVLVAGGSGILPHYSSAYGWSPGT
jgi:hypothetical protein